MTNINLTYVNIDRLLDGTYSNTKYATVNDDDKVILFEDTHFKINNETVYLDLRYTSMKYRNVVFRNCNFTNTKTDTLADINLASSGHDHVAFKNCFFKKIVSSNFRSINLNEIVCENISVNNIQRFRCRNVKFESIRFINSNLVNDLIITNKTTSFVSENSTFEGNVKIKDSVSNLIIKSSKIQKQLQIASLSLESPLTLNSIEVNSLSINNCKGENISITNSTIEKLSLYRNKCDFLLQENKILNFKANFNTSKTLRFNENQLKYGIEFSKNKNEKVYFTSQEISQLTFNQNESNLHFNNVSGDEFPSLENNNFNSVHIADCDQKQNWNLIFNEIEDISIANSTLGQLSINGKSVGKIDINTTSKFLLKSNLQKVRKFTLNNFESEKSEITIEECDSLDIQKVKIEKLSIEGELHNGVTLEQAKINKLELSIKTTDWFKIRNLHFTQASFAFISSSKFELINESINSDQGYSSLSFNKAQLGECFIDLNKLESLSIENFSSSKLESKTEGLKDLHIGECSVDTIIFGDNQSKKASASSWRFSEIPKTELQIEYSQSKELIINDTKDHGPVKVDFHKNKIDNLSISGLNYGLITIEECTIPHIIIVSPHQNKEAEFCIQNSNVRQLVSTEQKGKFAIVKSELNEVCISKAELSVFSIEDCKKENLEFSIMDMLLESSSIKNLMFSDSNIRKLTIKEVYPSFFKASDLSLKSLTLKSFEQSNTAPSKFELNFINTRTGTKADRLSFIDSNLSDLSFNSCYFGTFKELLVKSSKLDKINCTATTWPTKVTSFEGDNEKFEIREACRQLKLAMSNHQDKVNEIQFHALEMKAYKSIVFSQWKNWRTWNDFWSLFAGWTNGFGLNWLLPVTLLIFVIILNYIGLLWVHFKTSPLLAEFWDNFIWLDFFQLYNPTHRASQLSIGPNIGGWAAFLDFISKIISAFFIYQIVAAFRKFRRK